NSRSEQPATAATSRIRTQDTPALEVLRAIGVPRRPQRVADSAQFIPRRGSRKPRRILFLSAPRLTFMRSRPWGRPGATVFTPAAAGGVNCGRAADKLGVTGQGGTSAYGDLFLRGLYTQQIGNFIPSHNRKSAVSTAPRPR